MSDTEKKPIKKNHYDVHYSKGGWKYNKDTEVRMLKERILAPIGFKPPKKILEVGCGMGFHSGYLSELGYDVTAIDICETGIEIAKKNFPKVNYICGNLAKVDFDKDYDLLFNRGMSWYHYQLNCINEGNINVPLETKRQFGFIKKGGYYILMIATNFSGTRRSAVRTSILNNTLDEYIRLFERFGEIVSITDWSGKVLGDTTDSEGIIIITKK